LKSCAHLDGEQAQLAGRKQRRKLRQAGRRREGQRAEDAAKEDGCSA